MAEWGWRHWTVLDDDFADRWERDGESGWHCWIDRVRDGDAFRFELFVGGSRAGVYDGLTDAKVAARMEEEHG